MKNAQNQSFQESRPKCNGCRSQIHDNLNNVGRETSKTFTDKKGRGDMQKTKLMSLEQSAITKTSQTCIEASMNLRRVTSIEFDKG
jgi:hypothetical protein